MVSREFGRGLRVQDKQWLNGVQVWGLRLVGVWGEGVWGLKCLVGSRLKGQRDI